MSPQDVKRLAAWLRQQARAQGLREANAARDRLQLQHRATTQPRDAQGRWVK